MWFTWLIEGKVGGCDYISDRDAGDLESLGIKAVLSLTWRSPFRNSAPDGIVHLHLPFADMAAPGEEQLDRAVAFIQENVDAGRPTLVHCVAGLGRTGTVLGCYLVTRGVPAEEAIVRVRAIRPGSIETRGQEQCVLRYPRSRPEAG